MKPCRTLFKALHNAKRFGNKYIVLLNETLTMIDSILRRILQASFLVLLMSVLAFVGINLIGDPVQLLVDPAATPAEIEAARQMLGLDKPVPVQYWHFLSRALQGDLGNSFVYNTSAVTVILERMPATLELAFVALILSLGIGIPVGLRAGLYPDGGFNKFVMSISMFGVTMPTFWIGLIFILLFSVNLGWLPSGGRGPTTEVFGIALSITTLEGWKHLLLPALTLSVFKIALVMRLTESGTREVVASEYVKFARAKGVGPARLMFRHIAPNVLIPIVTAIGLEFGHLIAFSVITETVFAWPGMGKLVIDSILQLDRPIVVAYLMVTLLLFIFISLVVDILYLVLDPRLRVKSA